MDTQRYNQRVAEHQTETRVTELKTGLPIEKQCMLVYSQTLFYEVRKEIQKGLLLCFITKQEEVDGVKVYSVTHLDKRSSVVNEYTVKVDAAAGDSTFDAIPEKYIMARWRRDVLPRYVFRVDARYGGMKDEVMGKGVGDTSHDGVNEHVIANLLRVPEEVEGSCSNPQGIRNKDCGTNRRLVEPGEKAANRKKKTTRQCKTCFEFVSDNDSRNCPLKNKDPAP
ncbi:hypothetical protein M8C21_001277 [Ambrosia artemisiifolia]|uniref:Protein FAR1-RELATED SEQUENCE n=1 Tax=Ambrosia artemisiifolia TaxID=4212 RepID=A0AAD5C3B3_AMBAR|nr:hypothetical protein M8C21_001277 [Ambrosia artemisiifolia]